MTLNEIKLNLLYKYAKLIYSKEINRWDICSSIKIFITNNYEYEVHKVL